MAQDEQATIRSALQAELGFGGVNCPYCTEYILDVQPEDGLHFHCDPRPVMVTPDGQQRVMVEHEAMVAGINAARLATGREPFD